MLTAKVTCPHCHSSAPHTACKKCHRDMCEDCISSHPEVGQVCGLCYDHLTEPEEDEDTKTKIIRQVGIYETTILGAYGYTAKCFECGWKSRCFNLEISAVSRAKKHVCK